MVNLLIQQIIASFHIHKTWSKNMSVKTIRSTTLNITNENGLLMQHKKLITRLTHRYRVFH